MKKKDLRQRVVSLMLFAAISIILGDTSSAQLLIQPKPSPISPATIPLIASFTINNDAVTTTTRTVTLTNFAKDATQYMASERADFAGAVWTSYSTAPSFTLSTGDGVKTVYFRVKSSAGKVSSTASDTITLTWLPKLTDFYLMCEGESGATLCLNVTTELRNTYSEAAPLEYRASENPSFTNAVWKPYGPALKFNLSAGDGLKTVYFQLKNNAGTSNIKSATITLLTRRVHKIPAKDFFDLAKSYNFVSKAVKLDLPQLSNCILGTGYSSSVASVLLEVGPSSSCDFYLFDGRNMYNGFVFKSYDYSYDGTNGINDKITVTNTPQAGTSSVRFKMHGWADIIPLTSTSKFYLKYITIEGPIDLVDWKKAIMP